MSAPPGVAPPLTASAGPAPAVILGGSEDTRLLLRGLLRLHRHRILLEGPSAEGIDGLPASSEPKVLVLDAGAKEDSSWTESLAAVLQRRADLRALVILPTSDPALAARARAAGARAVLVRPFAIREFVEAVDSVVILPP